MKCFILFHSKYGQTEKIARRIGNALESKRVEVDIIESSKTLPTILLLDYDLVVIGAPLYAGTHSKNIARFVKNNLSQFRQKTTGFFSVSLSAFGDQSQRKDATRCLEEFLTRSGWVPTVKQIFAGGLPYRQYNWLTRWLMKRIVRKAGGDIDTSRDYEYTDWDQVDEFAIKLFDLASERGGQKGNVAVESEVGH